MSLLKNKLNTAIYIKIKIAIFVTISIIIILGAIWYGSKYYLEMQQQALSIDKTENVVTNIRNISEFSTACFYEEITLQEKKVNNLVNNAAGKGLSKLIYDGKNPILEDEIVIIARGVVRAGFDLSEINIGDLAISGDSIWVCLPNVKIFDIIVNPSGFEVYVEDGTWSHSEIAVIENRAKATLENDAINSGILSKAKQNGIAKLELLMKSFGFKYVYFD